MIHVFAELSHRALAALWEGDAMKVYGYSESAREADSVFPEALAELSLIATAGELRLLAEFLSDCANEMERMGDTFDHVHLSDRIKAFRTSPQFIVAGVRSR